MNIMRKLRNSGTAVVGGVVSNTIGVSGGGGNAGGTVGTTITSQSTAGIGSSVIMGNDIPVQINSGNSNTSTAGGTIPVDSKIVDDGGGGAAGANGDSTHSQLGLMHLKKLFNEYTHPKEPLNETERDYKLYNMLPLFCKVFGTAHANDMNEKFWDILAFCKQVSKLMVSEIGRRASNQSTEAASIAIVKFLEIENCEESSNGWMLLTTLNLLAAGDSALIKVMTAESVPSTLVKCLYLFFDLPEIPECEADEYNGGEFTQRERRILLQKVFVQVLVRLCSYPYPAEELAQMDDLSLLFSAITSQWPAYNILWRKSAAEILTTLSRYGLTDQVITYVHTKGCIALCIENMQHAPGQPLAAIEIVEMFVTVFCFLKDSSEVTQTLLDDFRINHGYGFLIDFLLKLESERQKNSGEYQQATIRNLVLMIASLCMCGFNELRPVANQTNSLFQMQGFQMPQTSSTRGTSVRNVYAFQVLQTVFLRSQSTSLCCTILDAISSVYHSDNANYFALEPQGTLCQFTEKIHLKHSSVQVKFFDLLEFIVFQLNFVPCKELISLSILLKSYHSINCSILCMKTLLNILRHHNVFKDVYREVGILEVFVTCLVKYSGYLQKHIDVESGNHDVQITNEIDIEKDPNEILGRLVIDALILLLNGNNNNANVFRESGGAKCVHEMVKFRHGRTQILSMIRELILSAGGEDDMLFILSTMHSAPAHQVELKIQILKALLGCLRDSHRTRTIFRKVGGFVYVTSIFVSLDGKLNDKHIKLNGIGDGGPDGDETVHDDETKHLNTTNLLQLLYIVCQTLATAMRFEPANAKFFHHEICNTSLCDTLRLLGCFGQQQQIYDKSLVSVAAAATTTITTSNNKSNQSAEDEQIQQDDQNYFHKIFIGNVLQPEFDENIPISLSFICLIYRLLYDIALDTFDKPNLSAIMNITTANGATTPQNPQSIDMKKSSEQMQTAQQNKSDPRSGVSTLNLTQPTPEPLIVHSGVVICMLQLLPSVEHSTESDKAMALQLYLSEVMKSLIRSERNQQIMCESGLAGCLLTVARSALSEEKNVLHVPMQYILERLAAQALKPTELREFLRLGSPLCCESPNLIKPYRPGGPIPLTRIKTLVSMTTPRDFRAHGSCTMPPFVEMDMSAEGFGCLYLPSVAPQTPNVATNLDGTIIGGIGSGDRIFPPQTGLTYSTWFCVDKFSDPRTDPHCVRLLTLIRNINNPRDDNLVCLTVLLSARDKAIIVSTQETLVPFNVGEWEPEGTNDSSARIWCPDLLHEGQWHHLVIVLNRAVLKNSSFSLFLDGHHMHTQKLHYISQNPGAGSANLTVANSIYAFIGTPPAWRRYSRLCWKQGVCHLIEDIINAQIVSTIFALGPHYMGSLQAPQLGKSNESINALVSEERVVFGLNAKAMTQLTLAKIRKVYSRSDNKAIAKQLGMSSHENATPIRILHNSAGHLAGPARTLGGVVVGYLGVRVFSPNPVSAMMDTVGGCNVLLGIIAMAQDVESMYAGVKALTCIVRSNRAAQSEMDRKRSYQTLAMFFKKKRNLLNSHILHLTFSLVGTVNSGQETAAIPNVTAFQDLLCDLDIWHTAPNRLLRSLLEHLLQLASESTEKRANIRIMRELQLVTKLLHIMEEYDDIDILLTLLSILLGGQPRHCDLLLFGQYIAAKLPLIACNVEKTLAIKTLSGGVDSDCDLIKSDDNSAVIIRRNLHIRNRCLTLLHSLLFTNRNTVNHIICDDISRILGMDWIILFLQPQVHSTTVILGMRILVVLCANDALIGRFKEGNQNGGYLRYTELVSQYNKIDIGHTQINQKTGSITNNSTSVGGNVSSNNNNTNNNVNTSGSNSNTGGGGGGNNSIVQVQPGIQLPAQIAGEVKTAVLHIPGFQYLEWLLPHHLDIAELYFLLTALIMGQPVKLLNCDSEKFDLDNVWSFLWGAPVAKNPVGTYGAKINLCPEAVCVLLSMVRTIVHIDNDNKNNNSTNNLPEWLQSHSVTIIQVLFSLYHNFPDFMSVIMLADVINALAAVLFPIPNKDINGNGIITTTTTTTSSVGLNTLNSTGVSTITSSTTIDSEPNSGASSPADESITNAVVVILPGQPQQQQQQQISSRPIAGQLTGDCRVRKLIIDFLRVIVVDSLSLSLTSKTTPVIDLVLDASPENSEQSQQILFQTEIISALMDHLLAADVLVGEQAALPIVPLLQSHVQNIAPNVFYLTARVVDKLWQGNLSKDPHEVFDFVIKLIAQAKRRSSSSLSLEQLHHSLNRVILYLLSRSTETVTEQMAVLEALHKLTTHRLLIFGAGNHELDFIGCLTYCLLQLTSDMKIVLDVNTINRNTTWHVNPNSDASTAIESRDDFLNQHQGKNLIVIAAFRVWEELYVCKKPAIEEVFKVTLMQPQNSAKAPDLLLSREQIIDSATKLWYNYVDLEKKSTYRVPWELHNQIQSKIQKVTGGLTRLASRSKVKKDEYTKIKSRIIKTKAFQWTNINLNLIRDLWDMKRVQNGQMIQHTQRYVYQDWLQSEKELIRERGLWGPVKINTLDKWLLDSTEGPHRMRKKTMKNDVFYLHYPYRPELELPNNRQLKYKVATSFDSKSYFTYCQLPPKVLCEPTEHSIIATAFDLNKSTDLQTSPSKIQSPTTEQPPSLARAQSEPGEEMDEEEDEVALVSDNQTLLRMLEEQEKISYMFRCARIQGLDTTDGLLLFGKEYCYVVDGFTLIKNREIRDIDSLPLGSYDPILPNPGSNSPRRTQMIMRQCSKFSYEDIREVHKRRYLLQPIALEVFSGDGRNYLLSFPRKVRNKVYQRFMATATAIADSAQQSVAGQKRGASVEQTSGIFSSLIGETSVTQRWVRGEISNFQYLMHLNTLAGRSYNDLMQYPVFPWILADYESEELDMTNPKTFRDFSKPMGAQSVDRLEQFQKRFKEWDDPHGETPPYHYGTHYSSAMIVCSYLVRLEPFTQHFLRLQGGHFDLADRMFHSIKEAWQSASKFNMADVKELIPEFFYLPEFMANTNNFDLGTKQNGESLGDVILPPWAKQDTREFIRVHRQALECDWVSQHLHQWIDLIFGCKQQGHGAVDAVNVFHHLFYEGNVDIYNIDDPLKKNATIDFINNFGQIPKQLFKKAHPSKKMHSLSLASQTSITSTSSATSTNRNQINDGITSQSQSQSTSIQTADKLFFHNLDNLKPSLQPIKELKGPVGQIIPADKVVMAVEQNKVMMAPLFTRYIAWGFADHSLRIGMYDSDRALFVCEAAAQNSGEILACACPNARTIVTAGTSSVVTVWEFDSRRKSLVVKQSLHGHTDAVTCIAASPAYNVIVSGSRDGTAIVWDMSRLIFVRQLRNHVGLVAAVCINDLTGDIATCSATWLHVWSTNGDPLAIVNTSIGSADRMQQILCIAFSCTREWDQQNVIITGSTDGVVRMWSMEYVQVPLQEKPPIIPPALKATPAAKVVVAQPQPLISNALPLKPSPIENELESNKSGSVGDEDQDQEDMKSIKNQRNKMDLIKQMSTISTDGNELVKSGSESSISETCDSIKESSKHFESERDNCSDKEMEKIDSQKQSQTTTATSSIINQITNNDLEVPKTNMSKRGSLTSAKSLHELKHDSSLMECNNNNNNGNNNNNSNIGNDIESSSNQDGQQKIDDEDQLKNRGIRPSKSDTSLTDSFVMIDNEYSKKKMIISQNVLRTGFKWQRQLVFRSKLTMHTAYDRKDNTEPASITALAVSKDHKTLYVGDARGRVFSWSVTEQPGRGMADHWLKDEGAEQCVGCHVRFALYERKHHCRNCGQIFCNKCSRFESEISRLNILKPVRVCQSCYATLRHHHSTSLDNN